jgi:malate dehydrogenase
MDKKVTVVGAGHVGATAAQRLSEKGLSDVVLVDIIEGVPQGKALDLMEAAPIEKHDSTLVGVNAYEATA